MVINKIEEKAREQFFAAHKMVFIAPDVPPVLPRTRRNDSQVNDFVEEGIDDEGSPRRRQRRTTAPKQPQPNGDTEKPQKPATPITEPQKLKGSTRLEAKKQRRREGRDAGRRRVVITESEFLARREAVDRSMIVRTFQDKIQIGVLEDNVLVEHYVARAKEESLIGNVYLGKVQNVLPSMEAAFVDIGKGRNAVLYSGEVDWSEFEGTNQSRKIESALKPGDKVLVQVTKDPVGHKGARLTSQISLPGRFLVYVPGGSMNGISRKLPDTERARLKKILKDVLPDGVGVIVRTAAEGASEEHLKLDVKRLTKQWAAIKSSSEKDQAPALLHSESDMLIKIVRDVFNEDFARMVVSGKETHKTIEHYLLQVAPELTERIALADVNVDVFQEYRITEQIAKALDRKVWLPSGGSLVIDRTEAMTVVDVNTGKFVGSGGNLEETVTKNNLEAAEEIVRQLRLRDIGGIIVVDFIDMVLESNRDLVLRRMIECLSRDRTKHQVAEVTSLGLVQMTRKKLGLGLLESFSDPCEVCAGRGVIVQHDPVSHDTNASKNSKRKPTQPSAPVAQQPHAITDGAKNMIAKIAASTIQGASVVEPELSGNETLPTKANTADRKTAPRETTAQHDIKQNETVQGDDKPAQTAKSKVPESDAKPEDILSSLLDALPEPPEVGESRLRSRRVTRMQQRSESGNIIIKTEDNRHADESRLTDDPKVS